MKKIDKKNKKTDYQEYLTQFKSEERKIFFILIIAYIVIFIVIPYLSFKLFFWNI